MLIKLLGVGTLGFYTVAFRYCNAALAVYELVNIKIVDDSAHGRPIVNTELLNRRIYSKQNNHSHHKIDFILTNLLNKRCFECCGGYCTLY